MISIDFGLWYIESSEQSKACQFLCPKLCFITIYYLILTNQFGICVRGNRYYYCSVNYYLENDSRYEGFRFATADEVRALADSLFPENGTSEFSFSEQLTQHRLMGKSYEWNGGFHTGGLYKDESAGVFSIFRTKYNTYDITQVLKAGGTGVTSDENPRSVFYGHYVVATDASVSIDRLVLEDQMAINNVPLYGGAVAIGLFGLFANRKKKLKAT